MESVLPTFEKAASEMGKTKIDKEADLEILFDGRNPAPVDMVNIITYHYLEGFVHPRSCRISSINSMLVMWHVA